MLTAEKLAEAMERRYDEYVDALQRMVDLDCGSFSPAGVNRIADLCQERFEAGGWDVQRLTHRPDPRERPLGDVVIGRLAGPGGPRVLLLSHMDTVFEEGTSEQRPFRIEGRRAVGPGVSDMKSGLLAGFFAVEILEELGADGFGSITYVCNPDEEVGSPFSGPTIREIAADTDVAYALEAARENGDLVSGRKGVSDAVIEIVGRSAHAGVEPERGRSAVLEAAHKILALHAVTRRWPGVTVNVGVVEGGTRPNVVPDRCRLQVDVRALDRGTLRLAEDEVRRISETQTVPDVVASHTSRSWHPPMEKTPQSAALIGLANEIAAELGFTLGDATTGGASDGNTVAAAGVPTLDGLGPVGGGWHGPDEWLDLGSVVPRVALLAGMIARAGGRISRG